MTIRRRKRVAPAFKQPAPYNPISGQFAPIGQPVDRTRVAMMQVIEADTHDNYVVCRGYDPEARAFLNSVNVAKPYSARGTYGYTVGCVFAAAKPATRIGETPGVAETTIGCPADLAEVINILLDDDSNPIAWLDIGGALPAWEFGKVITAAISVGGSGTVEIYSTTNGTTFTTTSKTQSVFAPPLLTSGTIAVGKWVRIGYHSRSGFWYVISAEC